MISGIFLTLLACLLYLSDNPTHIEIIQRLEAIPYDIRLKITTPIAVNNTPPIVIIDIDEASLKQEGRWPWSRNKIAKLITKLSENDTALIALDVVQSEKEENSAIKIKRLLSELNQPLPDWFNTVENKLDADSHFVNTIKGKELVLGYPFHIKLITQTGKLPLSSIETKVKDLDLLTTINMLGYTANLREFTNNAAGSGFFSIIPDPDGTVRRTPIIAKYNDQIYPSLALETARLYLLEDSIQLHTANIGSVKTVTHLSLGALKIPTDARGQILIPYLGKQKHFSYLSASDLLHKNKPFPELENAIALIGTSAVGLTDLRPTPVQVSFPGVEIQANILHAILHPESIAYNPDWTEGATIVSLIILSAFMILIYPLLQPLSLVVTGTGLLLATFAFNLWLWSSQHINLPVIMSLLLIMSISSIYIIHSLLTENKARRQIHDMFGQYVPFEHIDKLIKNPGDLSTDGEKREMTVLFSDLRNFTSLSEPLSTRKVKRFLNQYLTSLTKVIFNNHGTIDKYVGDMVMAFWGAPLHDPQHASHAVQAALQMQQKISELQSEFSQLGIDQVAAGIGIHTGEMNVGDMGSDYRRAYTVLGDAVNLGSRLENLTKYYGVDILISENTKKQCPDLAFRYIDFVRVKGKQDAIRIYEAIANKSDLTEKQKVQLKTHEKLFIPYLSGDWKTAYQNFKKEYVKTQDPLYAIYLQRIEKESFKPPQDWDGKYSHHKK
jgi:adenylate cyclase